ncbi:YhdT family protein [Bibersteinia trehalosi]
MQMNHPQIIKEARWALWLTFLYILGWLAAYFLPAQRGLFGFPLWFEAACIFVPVIFILLISIVIKKYFKEIDLEETE